MRLHTLHELDRTEGTVQLRKDDASSSSSSLVLVPHPSPNDPNDPLRWPQWKKHVAFISVCAFTFLTNFGIGGLSSAFYIISLEFGKSVSETSDLLLWPILVLGVFNFFWVPLANRFGKRPVFVFASGLLCASYIWGATARTFESLLWSNIIAAFAGSSTEALGASIVNDLYFLHERGAKTGLYMAFISGGNTVGPLVCGFVVTGLSWRWHKWISVILTAINFLTVVFFVPETRYFRDDSSTSPFSPEPEPELKKLPGTGQKEPSRTPSPAPSPLPTIPPKSYLQQLSLYSPSNPLSAESASHPNNNNNNNNSNNNLLKFFIRPLPLFIYPAVLYAFLSYAASLVLTVSINILNPFVLQSPPYSWSPTVNGLINIPGLLGNILGSYAGGQLVDRFCDWRARRNRGVFEPESRLHLCALPLLVTGAGCVLFGYGVERTLHWTSLFFGYGMVSFALTAVPTITMAYVSDCLLPVNSDALMLVNGSKNIVAFGFLYGIVPWVEEVGYVDCFGAQAGIFVAVIGVGMVILIPFGARIRHYQAQWRMIL